MLKRWTVKEMHDDESGIGPVCRDAESGWRISLSQTVKHVMNNESSDLPPDFTTQKWFL